MPPINRDAIRSSGQRQLLRDKVYREVRRRIVGGEMSPGEQISIESIAAACGVSRTPVREGLLQLAEEELVVIVPQVGASVALVDLRKVAEAQFVREALERACLAAGMKVANKATLTSLDKALRAQHTAIRKRESAEFYLWDEIFHNLLCSMSGHSGISKITNSARAHLDRLRQLSLKDNRVLMETLYSEHHALVDALAHGDFVEADRTLQYHLRRIFGYAEELMQRHPEFFVEQDLQVSSRRGAIGALSRFSSPSEIVGCFVGATGR